MSELIIETCCGSADDVIQSEQGGADRAELNSALFLGGLTPSIGELDIALAHTSHIKILTMVRPRQGGFSYTDYEFETILRDTKELIHCGSQGIVFGFLTPEGLIDVERCKRILELIGGRDAIFHRAIDVVPDWRSALDTLCSLGVTRVLTSGQRPRAIDGKETIRRMIDYAGDRIQILPGAGINESNARELITYTGCRELHMSKRKKCIDSSVINNPDICFGDPHAPEEYSYNIIDSQSLRQVITDLRSR